MSNASRLRTVMLIDDEKFDQILYKRIIERSGLFDKTIAFQYPDQALEYLKQPDCEEVDILFLDINMPRLNGFEFLDRALAEIGPIFAKIVVVMLTTSIDPADRERAKSYQIVKEFMNKPLTIDALQKAVSLLNPEDGSVFAGE